MKNAVVQVAMPATATTQDFTDASISSDFKAALFFNTNGTANDTAAAGSRLGIGLVDGTNQAAYGSAGQDAAATSQVSSSGNTTWAAILPTHASGGDPAAESAYTSTLSNGVRITWSDIDAQQLINALMFGGSDVQAAVVTATFSGTGPPQTVTVTPGFTPDVLIAVAHGAAAGGNGNGVLSLGFYDRVGNTYAGFAQRNTTAVAAASANANLSSSWIAAEVDGSAAATYSVTVGNFTATQFDATVSTGATSDIVSFLCLKITGGVYKVGIADTPTSTGNTAMVSGMSGAPSAVLWLLTRMTATGTSTTDPAGHIGLGVSVNNGGSTQQMYACAQIDDAADPTVDQCQTGNAACSRILDTAGAADVQATVNSWDAGGVTLNFSNVSASALKIPYLAIGAASAQSNAPRAMFQMMMARNR